jgi:hypothetical protein
MLIQRGFWPIRVSLDPSGSVRDPRSGRCRAAWTQHGRDTTQQESAPVPNSAAQGDEAADSPAAGLVVQGNRGLRRKREEHDFVAVETVPEPEVSSANASNPCPPDRPLRRLEVGGAW